ncbi:UNVERIFIED_CONTAM: hypothetical protein Slati_4606600 [Sesamum latifolium]|uniref:Uncharacterized protein n=1 Tax=Sesamum latifolium TaxID=2727402 RepID=A0AAW2S1U0_9LAMI
MERIKTIGKGEQALRNAISLKRTKGACNLMPGVEVARSEIWIKRCGIIFPFFSLAYPAHHPWSSPGVVCQE